MLWYIESRAYKCQAMSNVCLYFCHWALMSPFSLDDHCQNHRNQLCDPLQLVFDQLLKMVWVQACSCYIVSYLLPLSSLAHPNHHLKWSQWGWSKVCDWWLKPTFIAFIISATKVRATCITATGIGIIEVTTIVTTCNWCEFFFIGLKFRLGVWCLRMITLEDVFG